MQRMVEEEDVQFEDEYVNDRDPSILHFLLAAGDEVSVFLRMAPHGLFFK